MGNSTKKFEGFSMDNNFNEALESAIDAARTGLSSSLVEWTLDKVSGTSGGIVGVRDLTVTIEASLPGNSDVTIMGQSETKGTVSFSGAVTKISEVDICMDGATHKLLVSGGEEKRLKANNQKVRDLLDKFSILEVIVTVIGKQVDGVECPYIRVFHVSMLSDIIALFAGGDLPRGI